MSCPWGMLFRMMPFLAPAAPLILHVARNHRRKAAVIGLVSVTGLTGLTLVQLNGFFSSASSSNSKNTHGLERENGTSTPQIMGSSAVS